MPMIEYRPVRDNVREPATDKKYRELDTVPCLRSTADQE